MSEFANRMEAQRQVLAAVNSKPWREELFGLSSKAIERWSTTNMISQNSALVVLLQTISTKLFFLANRSQEQVSESYLLVSTEVAALTLKIAEQVQFVDSGRPSSPKTR